MFFLQIADLHIGDSEKSSRDETVIITESIPLIRSKVKLGENICIVINGDIIDSSKLSSYGSGEAAEVKKRYMDAQMLLDLYKDELEKDYNVSFVFVIGNHDITHQQEFLELVQRYDSTITESMIKTQYSKRYDNEHTELIMINSCSGDQYKEGRIDYTELERSLGGETEEWNRIFVMHHTLMSMDDNDNSSLKNAAKLLKLIDRFNVKAVMHGHIHGRDILVLGKNKCKIIGVGALFSRNHADVNSQFNIINYRVGTFIGIDNVRYIADASTETEKWDVHEIVDDSNNTFFEGIKWNDIYIPLRQAVQAAQVLHNIEIHIKNSYEGFCKDLEESFEGDTLTIGKNHFTYKELGEKWEASEVPSELYFNHGACFNVNNKHGIEYIAEQLQAKDTSSRAILSTSNTTKIIESYSDEKKSLLPSLMSIQFSKGKKADTLYVHMHLRALEVGRFLKINTWEIYYLLKRLKKLGIRFEYVDIVISSFRAQEKEKFGCFTKTTIDANFASVGMKVAECEYEEICGLLKEKREASETIIHSEGLKNLHEFMKEKNKRVCDSYPEEVIKLMDDILELYEKLDNLHGIISIQSNEETQYEKQIVEKLNEVISTLENR